MVLDCGSVLFSFADSELNRRSAPSGAGDGVGTTSATSVLAFLPFGVTLLFISRLVFVSDGL
jgi:hypothetical protein